MRSAHRPITEACTCQVGHELRGWVGTASQVVLTGVACAPGAPGGETKTVRGAKMSFSWVWSGGCKTSNETERGEARTSGWCRYRKEKTCRLTPLVRRLNVVA